MRPGNPLRTLHGRLALTYGSVALVAVVASALYTAVTMRNILLNRVALDLVGEAYVIAERVGDPLAGGDAAAVAAYVDRIGRQTTASIVVVDGRGDPVAASATPAAPIGGTHARLARALAGETVVLTHDATSEGDVVQVVVPARTADGRVVGAVAEAYDFDDTRGLVWQVNATALLGAATAALAAAAIGSVFAALVAGPVRQAAASVLALADGRAPSRLPAPRASTDEVRMLIGAVNRLASQLAVYEQGRREFASDVSHELHALASAMQTAAEALERGAASADPALGRRLVAGLVGHTHRLNRLAQDLLELARAEGGRLEMTPEDVDLAEVVEGVVDEWIAEATRRGVTVGFTAPPSAVVVHADPVRVAQALGNLVENALKYAAAGGAIHLRLTLDAAGRVGRVAVEDSGPGIPEEVLPRVFDRYFRVEGRGGGGPGGMGLGLAIAAAIARAHGGDLSAENTGEGARFVLRLPLPGPTALPPAGRPDERAA